jgi:preprotein translocase subunit SecA
MAEIGRAILTSNRGQIRIEGGDPEQAAAQADRLGFMFLRDYMEARGLVSAIDNAPSKEPADVGRLRLKDVEKSVLLQTLDSLWREHLVTLEHLRQVIGFRSYAQRDPLNEYKSEAFQLFEGMLARLREDVTGQLMNVRFTSAEPPPEMEPQPLPEMHAQHINPATGENEFDLAEAALASEHKRPEPPARAPAQPAKRAAAAIDPSNPDTWGKVARNDKCPCGSGKKYKHCHGRHA